MNATKITFSISVECLSKDVIPHLLQKAADLIGKEDYTGKLTSDDGDTIEWGVVEEKKVTI